MPANLFADNTILHGHLPPTMLPTAVRDVWQLEIAKSNLVRLLKKSKTKWRRGDEKVLFDAFTDFTRALLAKHRVLDYRLYIDALKIRAVRREVWIKTKDGKHIFNDPRVDLGVASRLEGERYKAGLALERDYYAAFDAALGKDALWRMKGPFAVRVHAALAEMMSEARLNSSASILYATASRSSTTVHDHARNWLMSFRHSSPEERTRRSGELWTFVRETLPMIKQVAGVAAAGPSASMMAYVRTMATRAPLALRVAMQNTRPPAIDPALRRAVAESSLLRKTPPTAAQIAHLQLFALSTLADEARGLKDHKKRDRQLDEIAKRISVVLKERLGKRDVTAHESVLAASVVNTLMQYATSHHGPIEETRSSKSKFRFYQDLSNKALAMILPFKRSAQAKEISELKAGLIWARDFDATLALRRYKQALGNLRTNILPLYAAAGVSQERVAQLKRINPHWFAADGKLKDRVDVSRKDRGMMAMAREAQSYRNLGTVWGKLGIPIAGSFLGAGLGCAFGGLVGFFTPVPGGTVAGCKIGSVPGAFLGGGLARYKYQQHQVNKHRDAIAAAAATGMTLVTAREAAFYNMVANRAIMVDSAVGMMWASPSIGLYRFAGTTAWRLGRGTAQLYARVGGLKGVGKAVSAWGGRQADAAAAGAGRLVDRFVPSFFPGRVAVAGGGQMNMPMMMAGGGRAGGGAAMRTGGSKGPLFTRFVNWWRGIRGQHPSEIIEQGWGPWMFKWCKQMWIATKEAALFRAIEKPGPLAQSLIDRMTRFSPRAGKITGGLILRNTSIYNAALTPYAVYEYYKYDGRLTMWGGLAAGLGFVPAVSRVLFGLNAAGTRITAGFYLVWDAMQQWQSGGVPFQPNGTKMAKDAFWAGPMRIIAKGMYKGIDIKEVRHSLTGLAVHHGRWAFDRSPILNLGARGLGALGVRRARTWRPSDSFSARMVALEAERNRDRIWRMKTHVGLFFNLIKFTRPDRSRMKVYTLGGKVISLGAILGPAGALSLWQSQNQKGDPYNFWVQKMMAYGVGGFFIFPIKAPLGMDTAKAEVAGRLLYFPFQVLLNETHPKYINKVPSQSIALRDASRGRYAKAESRLWQGMTDLRPGARFQKWITRYDSDSRKGIEKWYYVHDAAMRRYIKQSSKLLVGAGEFGYGKTVVDDSGATYRAIDGARGYLEWIDWRLARVAKPENNISKTVFTHQIAQADVAMLERFVAMPASSYDHKGQDYKLYRGQLLLKARAILDKYASAIRRIRRRYAPVDLQKINMPRP